MSASTMSGFISNEQDEKLLKVFPESMNALQFVAKYMPLNGEKLFLYCNDCWIELTNINGRLHLEMGEGAA